MKRNSSYVTPLLAIALVIGAYLPLPAQITYTDAYPHLTFDQPVEYRVPPQSGNDVYVVEQPGRIRVFENDSTITSTEVFLDIRDRVVFGGEQGLLGMAFHPQYPDSNYFYVNYVASEPRRTVVSRFEVDPQNARNALRQSEQILLEVEQPYRNHNGGKLAFGPDGYLYIGFGDGGSAGDPEENGQDRSTLLGSLVRIDVDTTTNNRNYGIPADNPLVGAQCGPSGCREEIYAYGLRNPWRFSFDPANGRLWLADVGQNSYEEVNIIQKGGNYGWDIMEGTHCYEPSSGCDESGLSMPVWEYSHNVGSSITGGVVYRGNQIEQLTGKYIVADFVSNKVWELAFDGETATGAMQLFEVPNVAAFGTDRDGEVYMCSFDGNIYKIIDQSGSSVPPESDVPTNFKLDPNYPNPFNPTTNIVYSLPQTRSVTVRIYDSGGQLVRVVNPGTQQAGSHTLTLNAEGLSSGIYTYEVKAGTEIRSGKMTLIR